MNNRGTCAQHAHTYDRSYRGEHGAAAVIGRITRPISFAHLPTLPDGGTIMYMTPKLVYPNMRSRPNDNPLIMNTKWRGPRIGGTGGPTGLLLTELTFVYTQDCVSHVDGAGVHARVPGVCAK